jgi:hypothetical protein
MRKGRWEGGREGGRIVGVEVLGTGKGKRKGSKGICQATSHHPLILTILTPFFFIY